MNYFPKISDFFICIFVFLSTKTAIDSDITGPKFDLPLLCVCFFKHGKPSKQPMFLSEIF